MESEAAFGEDVGGELKGGLHVTLDLELSLHECGLGVELSGEEVGSVVVNHAEGGIGLAVLAVLDGSLSVLEVNRPVAGRLSLGGSDLHVVDVADLLDGLFALAGEVGLDLVEDACNFHC
jgi:hypothetical protein